MDAWTSNIMMNSIVETAKVKRGLKMKKIKAIPISPPMEKSVFMLPKTLHYDTSRNLALSSLSPLTASLNTRALDAELLTDDRPK